jgi:hypothetical protein
MEKPILTPIDFNSLSSAEDGTLKLSAYYIDYAFNNEGVHPADGMSITFYAKHWTPNPNEIVCLDATLRKDEDRKSWYAELKGQIYTSTYEPSRKYFSPFIGANTQRLGSSTGQAKQKIGDNPAKNKLSGVSVFMFPKESRLPDFSKIVGLDVNGLHEFFQFAGLPKSQLENGKYPSDTLLVRGGHNSTNK